MHVEPLEGESFDQLLRRFKTSLDKSVILREYKRKRYSKSAGELQRERPRPLRVAAPGAHACRGFNGRNVER